MVIPDIFGHFYLSSPRRSSIILFFKLCTSLDQYNSSSPKISSLISWQISEPRNGIPSRLPILIHPIHVSIQARRISRNDTNMNFMIVYIAPRLGIETNAAHRQVTSRKSIVKTNSAHDDFIHLSHSALRQRHFHSANLSRKNHSVRLDHECKDPPYNPFQFLLQRDETRRVRGTNTGPTVLDRLAVWLLVCLLHRCTFCHGRTYYEIENSPR